MSDRVPWFAALYDAVTAQLEHEFDVLGYEGNVEGVESLERIKAAVVDVRTKWHESAQECLAVTRIEVKAQVDIPPFKALGVRAARGDAMVALTDVTAYLTRVAAVFDDAGANRDIALSIRAIRDGLTEAELAPLEWQAHEGMVTVYDEQGRYQGCMGRAWWEVLLVEDGAADSHSDPVQR